MAFQKKVCYNYSHKDRIVNILAQLEITRYNIEHISLWIKSGHSDEIIALGLLMYSMKPGNSSVTKKFIDETLITFNRELNTDLTNASVKGALSIFLQCKTLLGKNSQKKSAM